MTYYHVRIVLDSSDASKPRHPETKLDLAREELEQRFLAPYRKGKPITINGKTMSWDNIERIYISETEQSSELIRPIVESEHKREQESPTMGLFLNSVSWDIAAKGETVTDKFITEPPGSELDEGNADVQQPRPSQDVRTVFVVHGRNLAARDALFEFLRAIDLHPLEWAGAVSATGKPSPYIGEILDAVFSRAHAVVVLFTPDDEAHLRQEFRVDSDPPHETQLTGQARPNVLFEAGMAMARSQDRTILVELGSLRPFSDVGGRHTIRLNNTSPRRQELAQRLEAAGCPVNLTGTDWHTVGDFDRALAPIISEAPETTNVAQQEATAAKDSELSEDAKDLLLEAVNDTSGVIKKIQTFSGLTIETNSRDFVKIGNLRSAARWEQAVEDLEDLGFIKDPTGEGKVFNVTHKGFETAEGLEPS